MTEPDEPDVLDDLNEMWPGLADPDGGKWNRHQVAAVMILASEQITKLRARVKELEATLEPTTDQTRREGYYWISRKQGDPQVARWEGEYWWIIGDECEWDDDGDEFVLLSDRLEEPT